jgi:NADPH2:quinone reductase
MSTMKAIVLSAFGEPDVLTYQDVPMPVPGEGEVLVRILAVSVNRGFDVVTRKGGSPFDIKLPLILGVDPSGEVIEAGPGVDRSRVGQRVFVSGVAGCRECANCKVGKHPCLKAWRIGVTSPGGYAQYIVVPQFQALPLGHPVDFAEATVIYRHAGAAATEIHTAQLQPGETVLVMGAAGGLGSFLVQMVKSKGATVIAAAGSPERVAAAMRLGADHGIDYRAEPLAERVRTLTGGVGVNLVFENIGEPKLFEAAFDSLADNGRLVTIGAHGGGIVPLDIRKLHMRRLRVLSSVMGSAGPTVLQDCLSAAARGELRSLIGVRLPLSQAAQGHRLVEEGKLIGKVILEPFKD